MNAKGFTITEVLAAVALISATLIPLTTLLNRASSEQLLIDTIVARNLAMLVMEESVFDNAFESGQAERKVGEISYTIVRELMPSSEGCAAYSVLVKRDTQALFKLSRLIPG